jgi:AraC-like DNA-binding protein
MDTYREILPAARLARYVECYWSREERQGTPGHSVLPDGCVDILFSARYGEPVDLSIVGLMTTRHEVDLPVGQCLFGVRFRPGMAAAFIPEAGRLTDMTEPIENLLGATGRELFDKLGDSANPAEKAAIMDRFLRPLEPRDESQRVLARLASCDLSVDGVASETGMSARQLRRVCVQRAGVSPKYLTRILRFRRAAEGIQAAAVTVTPPNWAEFAAGCGYFDQAHFIREFREFMGCTPGRYLQSLPRRPA